MPGLDVLRGLAIAAVLIDHGLSSDIRPYAATGSVWMLRLRQIFFLGDRGVHLFFILSGFLITGILLKSRADTDYYRNFYLRRVLRILPAYLLMIVVLFYTHSITARYIAVCLLYLCNMSGLLQAQPEYGPFWSLSVEEQFYLIWPLAVRRLSLRGLAITSGALVLLTPLLRLALLYGPHALRDITYKPWVLADFFAAGALLAIGTRSTGWLPRLHRLAKPALLAGLATTLLFVCLAGPIVESDAHGLGPNVLRAVELEPWLILFSALLLLAWLKPGIASTIWAKPFVFLGKISYGLYLCHLFVFRFVDGRWDLGLSTTTTPTTAPFHQLLLRFSVETTLAIVIATLSRFTFEEFFLRRKPKHHHRSPSRNASDNADLKMP